MVWCGIDHYGINLVYITQYTLVGYNKKYSLGWGGTERRMVWRAKGCSGASLGQWQVTGKRPLNFLTKVLKPRISVVSLWVLFRYRCENRCVNWDTIASTNNREGLFPKVNCPLSNLYGNNIENISVTTT